MTARPTAGPRVAHVVRRYGGVTEPFIEQRVSAPGQRSELWFERLDRPHAGDARRIDAPLIRPGSLGDRVLHRWPALARAARRAYAKAERLSGPDVIHAHYLTTGFVVGHATRAPLVVSTYGFDVTVMPRQRLWRRAIEAVAARAAAVLVEGPHMRDLVERLGVAAEHVEIVPIAAELDGIAYRQPRADLGGLRILVCGRMVEKKGHAMALRAFSELADELPVGSTLDVVGDGPLGAELRALCGTLAAADRIRFHGPLARIDYLALLGQADLLLAPSRTARNGDGEGGAPTTILDAQATGVVVIGSTHADIPYLVEDGVTGLLFSEGSLEGLREAMLRAATNVSAWPAMTEAARQQVLERHSDAEVSRRLAAIHEAVASR